jgi:predicted AAA+ superfamily ATPase
LIDYLNFGGYPRVILEKELAEKARVMNEIYRSYVEKDIAYFLGVNRVDAFSLLIRILASQTGQILKYSKLAQESGLSTLTLKNYLWYAERTFSIRLLSPYFKNKHKEIIKAPSVYFYDLGMRNFSLNSFGGLLMPDYLGFVFQNFIANLLQAKIMYTAKSLNFWRTIDMAEVDFVINSSSDILPIEVKYSCLKKPEVTRSLRSFILRYAPSEAWVVNLSLEAEMIIGNTKVRFIPYYTIALNRQNMV